MHKSCLSKKEVTAGVTASFVLIHINLFIVNIPLNRLNRPRTNLFEQAEMNFNVFNMRGHSYVCLYQTT